VRGGRRPFATAAMLIRVSDPTLVPELVGELQRCARYVVEQVGGDTVAVGVLGSFADGGELELTIFLLAWQAARTTTTIELIER
jgi:hypothetical protein